MMSLVRLRLKARYIYQCKGQDVLILESRAYVFGSKAFLEHVSLRNSK